MPTRTLRSGGCAPTTELANEELALPKTDTFVAAIAEHLSTRPA